jgi:hypothetical protein
MAFDQDKKPGFFGTDASWNGGSVIGGAHNDQYIGCLLHQKTN